MQGDIMDLHGKNFIGRKLSGEGTARFSGINPTKAEELEPSFYKATEAEIDQALALAERGFEEYREQPAERVAGFLERIAEDILGLGDELIRRALAETALPEARLTGERARTVNQLKMFADLVREGSWVDARIDRAMPDRKPLPKPDLRRMLVPIGPVVVFCASNFPLAFSVAGGDTASALAGGNPVIVKAHPAHPGTAELVGLEISDAVRHCELPAGLFSLLFGAGSKVGPQLMDQQAIRAGGFTGSRAGGQALMKMAAAGPDPIPFYAEMSSVNPVFILPDALREREEQIALELHGSVTLGAGQFCTNPGLVFIPADGSAGLIERLTAKMSSTAEFTMLTRDISRAYCERTSLLAAHSLVKPLCKAAGVEGAGNCNISAGFFLTDAQSFSANPELAAEVFGPATLLITYSTSGQLPKLARALEGQLTATIHATESELRECAQLLQVLETKAGRIICNGFPTGVEVSHSMVHGGPFPATSDGRSTSVGTRAVLRFVRPVCYQDWPSSALPDELKNSNPLNIWRLLNGEFTKSAA